jgi:hypothetical protein
VLLLGRMPWRPSDIGLVKAAGEPIAPTRGELVLTLLGYFQEISGRQRRLVGTRTTHVRSCVSALVRSCRLRRALGGRYVLATACVRD